MEEVQKMDQWEFPIEGIHHIELFTGNAKQAAYYYSKAFGFAIVAYLGLETGSRNKTSYVLKQGEITLVLSGTLDQGNEVAHFVNLHGDGVRDIAFRVKDIEEVYRKAIDKGAIPLKKPWREFDEYGVIRYAQIGTYGDTIHTLVDDYSYRGGNYAPGYIAYKESDTLNSGFDLHAIDHVVGNVEKMDSWTDYYECVFGFRIFKHFSDNEISTEYSALMSKVMSNGSGSIKFPINEPAVGKRKSQIQEFLDYHKGPGVQHIAYLTTDIISTVEALKSRGVEFLYTPPSYYEELKNRVGAIEEDVARLAELGILVDRDQDGYLLQIFTQPLVDRPTLFFEIIQRKGAKGFGDGNFKALFESIEREQQRRGNL